MYASPEETYYVGWLASLRTSGCDAQLILGGSEPRGAESDACENPSTRDPVQQLFAEFFVQSWPSPHSWARFLPGPGEGNGGTYYTFYGRGDETEARPKDQRVHPGEGRTSNGGKRCTRSGGCATVEKAGAAASAT